MAQPSALPNTGPGSIRTGFPFSNLLLITAVTYFITRAENLPPLHLAESITLVPQGIYLINGIHINDIAFAMPLPTFLAACIYGLPKWCENMVWPLFYLAMGLLSFATGRALRSKLVGAITVLLMSYALGLRSVNHLFSGLLLPMLYSTSCGLVLLALLRRAGRPRSWQLELTVAISIGISFMIKSPLALFPPLLVLWDIASGKLKRGETNWKLLAILCLVPYAMLLPWIYMNYSVDHVFRLFEGGRADETMITGALGIVFSVEGAYPLANLPHDANFKLWAVQTVLSHPLPYIEGVIKRIYSLIVLYPLASVGLTAALLRFRADKRFQTLGLMIVYFVGMHCLLSIQEAYFVPLWLPVLAACASLFDINNAPAAPSKAAKTILAIILPIMLAAYLAVSAYLLAYPTRVTLPSRIFNSEEALPGANPILLVRASEFALYNGDIPQAYIKARSALLQRYSSLTAATYLRALSARGIDIEPPLRNRLLTRMDHNERLRYLSLLLLNSLQKDTLKETERLLVRLRSEWKKWRFSFHKVTSQREEQLYKQQQEVGMSFEEECIPGILTRLSQSQRRRFAAKIRSLWVDSNQLLLMELGLLTEDPEKKEELRVRMAEIAKRGPSEDTMLTLVRLSIKSGLYKDAIKYSEQVLKKKDSIQASMHLADALLSDGQLEKAQAQLEKIEAMPIDNADELWLADIKKKRDSRISVILNKINSKHFAEGVPEARRFLAVQNNDISIRLAFSEALLLAKNYPDAAQFLREVNPADLQSPQHLDKYRELIRQLTIQTLEPLLRANNHAELHKQASSLLDWNPENIEARLYLTEALIAELSPREAQKELAYAAQKKLPQEQWEKVIRLNRVAETKIAEQERQAREKVEKLFRESSSTEDSKVASKVLAENPDNVIARIYLAETLLKKGNLNGAQEQISVLAQKQLAPSQRKELQDLTRELAKQRKMQELDKNLRILDDRGQHADAALSKKAAAALIETDGYRITGMLHMAQILLKENNYDEARAYLAKLQSMPLSEAQKTWADSIEKQISELLSKNFFVEKSRRLQEVQKAADQPKKLLPLARRFTQDYPQETTGKLYLAAALIATGELDQAQTEISELRKLALGEQDKAWLQSLSEYLEREQNKCSFKNPKACISKLKH